MTREELQEWLKITTPMPKISAPIQTQKKTDYIQLYNLDLQKKAQQNAQNDALAKVNKQQNWSKTADTISAFADAIPRRQSEDIKINAANQLYDAASSAVAAVPVVGTAISAGMKGIKAIEGLAGSDFGIKHTGKGGFWGQHNKMSDSTWSLLVPSGWINRFTKTKVEGSDTDLAKGIRGYGVTEATPQEEIGGFSQSMAKFWSGQDLIGEAKKRRDRVDRENLAKNAVSYLDTQRQELAQNNLTKMSNKNYQTLSGGLFSNSISAKKGAKINPASLRSITKKVKAKQGTKLSFDEWYKKVPVEKNDTTLYNLRRAFELAPKEQLDEFIKNKKAHLMSAYLNPKTGIYEFVKSKKHESINKELDWYNSKDKDAVDFRSKYKLYDDGSDYYKYVPIQQFQQGGVLNVIPDGALHARKHDLPDEIKDQVTNKGIPVISYDEGGDITQHAEIEVNEIIFSIDTTKQLEEFHKKYNDAESDEEKMKIAIECGKFLASEILENTDDRTGLIDTIE